MFRVSRIKFDETPRGFSGDFQQYEILILLQWAIESKADHTFVHEATFVTGDTATLFVTAAHEISNVTFYKNRQLVYIFPSE